MRLHWFITSSALLAGCAGSAGIREHDTEVAAWSHAERDRVTSADVAFGAALDRASLVAAVLARNPDLDAARASWRAAIASYIGATALPDPTASYELAPLTIGSDVRFGQRIAVSQKLPWPGKRALAGEAALADADVADADYATLRLALADAAVDAFDDDYIAARALEVNAHHRELLERIEKSATVQYTVGKASQQDPIEARTEIIALDRERLALETQQRDAVARLNRLLHRRADAELPPPPRKLEIGDAAPASTEPHPQLVAAKARLRARTANVERSNRAFYPDIEVMASYDSLWDAWQQRWMIGVAIDIPLQRSKRRAETERAQAEQANASAEIESTTDMLDEQRDRAARAVDEGRRELALDEQQFVPAARERVDAALAGFSSGQNTFSTVVMAEHMLRDAELQVEQARAELDRRLAALDRAEGRVPGGAR